MIEERDLQQYLEKYPYLNNYSTSEEMANKYNIPRYRVWHMSNSTGRKYEKYVNKRDKVYQEILSIPILEEVFKLKKKEIKNIIKKNNKFIDDEKIKETSFEKYSDEEILFFWNKTAKKYEDYLTILDLAVPRTLVEVEEIIDKKIGEYLEDYKVENVLMSLLIN